MIYPSVIRFSLEDSDRLNILQTDLNTKVNEMAIKFVIGEESFDNWDQYLDALKRLGSEEYAWKLQRAYDIFMRERVICRASLSLLWPEGNNSLPAFSFKGVL